jgi:Tfp pilus assembly major pilin PilA
VLLTIILVYQFKQNYHVIQKTEPVEKSTRIEDLRDSVEKLVQKNVDLQTAYDNKQTTVINNIINKNNQDGKKINAIPLYSNTQLDSVWASKSNTEKDSIPRGYWDILNQKTGGRSIKDLRVQRDIQE